jgi:hypothetical protein
MATNRVQGDRFKELNRTLLQALGECEKQLANARRVLEQSGQDNQRQFTDRLANAADAAGPVASGN